jgi:hypothetical protein
MQCFETRCYGLNLIIKEYAHFPRFLPLPGHVEHGWTAFSNALITDLKNDKPLMMVFSKRREKAWKKKSKKPVVILGAPFIHYKNIHNITKKSDAKGTVVFPSHSTYDLKSSFSLEKYCQELADLPERFKPITVCLFWLDYIDKESEIYKKFGFSITTTGPKLSNSIDFVKNFYNILSSHKYATSNEVGSYTFYAVDLNLPFFLTGIEPIIKNKDKRDINFKEISKLDDHIYGKKAMDLFSTGPATRILNSQKKFVIEETGLEECIPPEKLNSTLWEYYRKNKYWQKAFVPYLFFSCLYAIFFNGPWIKLFISMRKRIGNV